MRAALALTADDLARALRRLAEDGLAAKMAPVVAADGDDDRRARRRGARDGGQRQGREGSDGDDGFTGEPS